MSINLKLGLVIVSLLIFIVILVILKKGRMPIKYSLIWIFSSFIILLVALIPDLFYYFSNILGFITMSNMVIGMFIFILVMINIALTVIISGQQKKISLLIQELSMLKEKVKNEK